MIKLMHGDCLVEMQSIPDKSVDMVLCDLPYEVLNKNNKNAQWDRLLPFDKLWGQYERVIKDNGAIVLFALWMFTARLMVSNPKLWRYNLIWDKVAKSGFLNANKMPLRRHEDICVFYKNLPTYNPQMEKCEPHQRNHTKGTMKSQGKKQCYGKFVEVPTVISDEKFPTSIISVSREHCVGKFFHPTQKPVALLEYLIKTYSNEGDTILDNCGGSFSTAIAAINTNRCFIGIEKDENYFSIGTARVIQRVKSDIFSANVKLIINGEIQE